MLKRRYSRSTQYLSERINQSKASKVDSEFLELRQKVEVYNVFTEKIQAATKEFMQPNPHKRTTTSWKTSYLRVAGQDTGAAKYPQVESSLAQRFMKFSVELYGLRDPTPYEWSLKTLGESFEHLSESKDLLESELRNMFLYPLSSMQEELHEILDELKKFDKRRLEYDYNRNNKEKVSAINLETSRYKYESSKRDCYMKMMEFTEKESEHIYVLYNLVRSLNDYHGKCREVMNSDVTSNTEKMKEASFTETAENKNTSDVKVDSHNDLKNGRHNDLNDENKNDFNEESENNMNKFEANDITFSVGEEDDEVDGTENLDEDDPEIIDKMKGDDYRNITIHTEV